MKKAPLSFSWFGFAIAAGCLLYFIVIADPQRMADWGFSQSLAAIQTQYSVIFVFILAVIFDAMRFQRQKRKFDELVLNYEEKLGGLLAGKNKLQNKVHKYSDHADKLKLFISDRLLEYIEYDEKFLHFRHIASEVRHNGVISYDKVNTALRQAIRLQKKNADTAVFEEALRNMAYLWDLLDLSTTDNIAMYIANKIYESEEHFYRQMLDENDSPYSPTFSTRLAVLHSLEPFVTNREGTLPEEGKKSAVYRYQDAYFWVQLYHVGEMLGNENYLILMLENLINNALYYQNNKKYGHKYSRISVKLTRSESNARISVYNSGPNIEPDLQEEIFQLGFSTKRTKGHHGKGLGLYFVNEIVKGHEGEIRIKNIVNKPETYVLRFEMENGETLNKIVEVRIDDDGKPLCSVKGERGSSKDLQYKLEQKLRNLEISLQSTQKTYVANRVGKDGKTVLLDPQRPAIPRWCIEIHHLKSGDKVFFKPLDATGVEFVVLLPTAESRLDSEFHELDEEATNKLENPDIEFINTDPYR